MDWFMIASRDASSSVDFIHVVIMTRQCVRDVALLHKSYLK